MQSVKISVVIPFYGNRAVLKTIELLDNIKYVDQFIFITDKETIDTNTKQLTINSSYPFSDKVIKYICEKVKADYILFITEKCLIEINNNTIEQFLNKATYSMGGLLYSDYCEYRRQTIYRGDGSTNSQWDWLRLDRLDSSTGLER